MLEMQWSGSKSRVSRLRKKCSSADNFRPRAHQHPGPQKWDAPVASGTVQTTVKGDPIFINKLGPGFFSLIHNLTSFVLICHTMSTFLRQGALSLGQRMPIAGPPSYIPQSIPIRSLSRSICPISTFQAARAPTINNRSRSGGDQKTVHDGPTANSFSFKDLGANRTVKVVVISVLMVFGTLESIFWIKFLWAKFGPSPTGEEEVGKSIEKSTGG